MAVQIDPLRSSDLSRRPTLATVLETELIEGE